MTRQDLEKHLKMRRQLMECRDILQNLKRSVGPGTQALTGMPHAPGVKDKVGDLATEIAYMERRVAALQAKVDDQAVEVRNFIAGVQDDQMKIILSLRYIRGLTWIEVGSGAGREKHRQRRPVGGMALFLRRTQRQRKLKHGERL